MANIQLPINDQQQLIVKYSLEEKEEAEVIYLYHETSELNVARFIYEYICLAMPMIKVYDCENEDPSICNEEVFKYLDQEPEKEEKPNNPIWDQLNELKDN